MPGARPTPIGEDKNAQMPSPDFNSLRFCDLPDEEILRLVESLNSLHEGELGVPMLVACGERAVGFLRQLLLYGKPSSLPQPRERAVRALAELGAKDVLLEYLGQQRPISDPAIALGEEAVQNTAARLLRAWRTEDVFQQLLQFVEHKPIAGVIETLGEFARPEPVPYFIAALGDDVCRRPSEDALCKIGRDAITALIEAARTPEPSGNFESPSSLRRRQSVLRVLADLSPATDEWPYLKALLYDSDAEIALTVAGIGMRLAPDSAVPALFARILRALPQANWLVQSEIEEVLVEHWLRIRALLECELSRRLRQPRRAGAQDLELRFLQAVRTKAGGKHLEHESHAALQR
jgi:hypothetical protein